jgi:hypothetical protein
VEPEFILVSCSGAARAGLDATDVSRIVAAKRRGEDLLRSTGLGYTVIRPGPLVVGGLLVVCASAAAAPKPAATGAFSTVCRTQSASYAAISYGRVCCVCMGMFPPASVACTAPSGAVLFGQTCVDCVDCLQDEPGGYKALVFDQGDRVSQSVSAADVADICLRALHESEVRRRLLRMLG